MILSFLLLSLVFATPSSSWFKFLPKFPSYSYKPDLVILSYPRPRIRKGRDIENAGVVEGRIGLERKACSWQGGYGWQNHFYSGLSLFPLLWAEGVDKKGHRVIGRGTAIRVGSSKSFLLGALNRGHRYYRNMAAYKHPNKLIFP
jgi:hypothetical protein